MPRTTITYNQREIEVGRLTPAHLRALRALAGDVPLDEQVRRAQIHYGLHVDGRCGPITRGALMSAELPPRCWPVIGLPGRTPVVSSGYGPRGARRRMHYGSDIFSAPWHASDPEPVDPRYGVHRRSGRRWVWYPDDCHWAIASAGGVVRGSRDATNGWRIWIDHELDHWTLYLHLDRTSVCVEVGDLVEMGQPLACIAPGIDPPHLHFEHRHPYARPVDPELSWLVGAEVLTGATVEQWPRDL